MVSCRREAQGHPFWRRQMMSWNFASSAVMDDGDMKSCLNFHYRQFPLRPRWIKSWIPMLLTCGFIDGRLVHLTCDRITGFYRAKLSSSIQQFQITILFVICFLEHLLPCRTLGGEWLQSQWPYIASIHSGTIHKSPPLAGLISRTRNALMHDRWDNEQCIIR
jgi:hypothetical protein